jgi:hypothetical protein
MKRIAASFICISILLSSCSAVQNIVVERSLTTGVASEPASTQARATAAPAAKTPKAPQVETSPSSTPTVTPVPIQPGDTAKFKASLAEIINSEYWQKLGLPGDIAQKWQAYATGKGDLSDSELQALAEFITQWEKLNQLAKKELAPADASLGFRVKEFSGGPAGKTLTVYAIEEKISQGEGAERLFLIAHGPNGESKALVLAPKIVGLGQQIAEDGESVLYTDKSGTRALLVVDARPLGGEAPQEKQLKELLDKLYGSDSAYAQVSIYPRYQYPLPNGEVLFYGIDQTLTYNQVVLLRESLDLFNRPVFEPLKAYLFTNNDAYTVIDKLGLAAGLTFTGTGVVELDRRDLFSNKYYLASVIAHEGSHVLQGPLTTSGSAMCADLMRREVGDHTIPTGFFNWTADQLEQAIQDGKIGAYHVSLWVLTKLGISNQGWIQQAILTGQAGGQSVVNCNQ